MPKGATTEPVIESPDHEAIVELKGSTVRVQLKDQPDPVEGKVALADDRGVVVLENRGQMNGHLLGNVASIQKIKRLTLNA